MHGIYCTIWDITITMNKKTFFRKKPLFLFLNIFFWSVVGMLLYLVAGLIPFVEISIISMFMSAGYFGVVMGFFGSVMYIFRNTEPEDLLESERR